LSVGCLPVWISGEGWWCSGWWLCRIELLESPGRLDSGGSLRSSAFGLRCLRRLPSSEARSASDGLHESFALVNVVETSAPFSPPMDSLRSSIEPSFAPSGRSRGHPEPQPHSATRLPSRLRSSPHCVRSGAHPSHGCIARPRKARRERQRAPGCWRGRPRRRQASRPHREG
jgi:hypothetical protein